MCACEREAKCWLTKSYTYKEELYRLSKNKQKRQTNEKTHSFYGKLLKNIIIYGTTSYWYVSKSQQPVRRRRIFEEEFLKKTKNEKMPSSSPSNI